MRNYYKNKVKARLLLIYSGSVVSPNKYHDSEATKKRVKTLPAYLFAVALRPRWFMCFQHLWLFDSNFELARLSRPTTFEGHSTNKLWPAELLKNKTFVKEHVWEQELPPVYFSCPEKAIFEVLLKCA